MSTWEYVSVGSCLEPVNLPRSKLQTKDYNSSGVYPIVDQGQDLIAGWTDNEEGLIRIPLPVIIFGDHTRIFKYIDFPFIRGADGTQVLYPDSRFYPGFFYFACTALDIKSRGYNRHFTILKQLEIPVPPKDDQEKIGKALALVESVGIKQQDVIDHSSNLKRATMRELFTHGLRGGAQKETEIGLVPESWEIRKLGRVAELSTGTTPATKHPEYFEGKIPFIKTTDITNNRIASSTTFISEQAIADYSLKVYKPGTVLMAMYGQGKTRGQVSILDIPASTTQNAAAIEPNDDLDSSYLWHFLLGSYERLRGMGSLGHISHLNLGYLRELVIPLPPTMDEQREIVEILDAIDRKIELHKKKKALLEELFTSLLHKLMAGEINVSELDLGALTR
jgi:type I restriction enzyme, S subunit